MRGQRKIKRSSVYYISIVFLTLSLFSIQTQAHAADMCVDGLRDLQGSQGVIQDKGGIWGYLEKSSSLRDKSILGLQIDGKLQRLIVSFEGLCEEGKTPTPKLYNLILNLIGDTRMIFNRDPDRQPKEKILEKLNGLNKNISDLLAQLPN
ncbi:MAG: hypothetical protein ABGX43_02840 [Nitrospinaceae bacterium]|jgi:hypothetical protein|nr:hypothetical protein [Nitrospinaceae bacterium]